MINKKILIANYDIPYYSDTSTSSYNLFRTMVENKVDVHYLNFIREDHEVYYKCLIGEFYGNPGQLNHVHNCILNKKVFDIRNNKSFIKIVNNIEPDLIIGSHYIPAYLIKKTYPDIPFIYYATNCMQFEKSLSKKVVSDFISSSKIMEKSTVMPKIIDYYEKNVIELSNLIITNSEIIQSLFLHFYYPYLGKIYTDIIYNFEWNFNDAFRNFNMTKPFNKRTIDITFISDKWNSIENNKTLLDEILKKLRDYNICVIDQIENKYNYVDYKSNVEDRTHLFSILGNSKCVVNTSKFDPSPVVLYKASAMDCNIVSSQNCGSWQLCNEELLVEEYKSENYIDKIKKSVQKKYNDNKEFFIRSESYEKFINVINVF